MKFIWHIPTPGSPLPTFYVDRDTEPVALRIYAGRAPDKDLLVDILDDGVSIMNSNNYQVRTNTSENAYIEFGTPSATAFTVNETITGGTSGATAKVQENKCGRLTLILDSPSSTVFTVGETITGGSSTATGVVNAYVRQLRSSSVTTKAGQSRAILPEGKNSSDTAQDFKAGVYIAEGSWLSLSVLNDGGAGNVTIQLDTEDLAENSEIKVWAETL